LADRGGAGGGQVYAGAVYLSCVLLLVWVCRVPDIFSLVCAGVRVLLCLRLLCVV